MLTKDRKSIQQMFDEISPTYDLLNHLFTVNRDKKWRRKAVKRLASTSGNILDLAAGTGDFAKEFMRLNPYRIYSADISFRMLRICRDKVAESAVKRHAFSLPSQGHVLVQTDAETLPFKDNSFDVAGAAFGVRNFERLENCISEVSRVLKPGGQFVTIEMFGSVTRNGLFGFYFRHVVPRLGNIISHSNHAYNYLFDSVDSFMGVDNYSELLSRNGFNVSAIVSNFAGIVYTVYASKK